MAASSTSTFPAGGASAGAARPAKSPEPYQSLEKREAAAQALQSYEQLSWYAARRRESIPQTRLYCQSIIAGFNPDPNSADSAPYTQWKTDNTPHVPDPPDWDPTNERVKTSAAPAGKGKQRVSGEGVAGPSGVRSPGSKGRERSLGSGGGGTAGGSEKGKKKRKSESGGR